MAMALSDSHCFLMFFVTFYRECAANFVWRRMDRTCQVSPLFFTALALWLSTNNPGHGVMAINIAIKLDTVSAHPSGGQDLQLKDTEKGGWLLLSCAVLFSYGSYGWSLMAWKNWAPFSFLSFSYLMIRRRKSSLDKRVSLGSKVKRWRVHPFILKMNCS